MLEIEAALLLVVQLRRKLPRLVPLCARCVALHTQVASAAGVALLDTHDALLLHRRAAPARRPVVAARTAVDE